MKEFFQYFFSNKNYDQLGTIIKKGLVYTVMDLTSWKKNSRASVSADDFFFNYKVSFFHSI